MSDFLNTKKPFYKQWWGLLITFAFFPLVLPYIIFTQKSISRWVKIVVTIFCGVIIVIGIFGSIKTKQQENEALDKKNLQSTEFLKETLINMYDNEFELLKNGKLNKEYLKNEEYNKLFLAKLQENASNRSLFIEERKNEIG